MEGGRANGPWAVRCDGLAGVGCCNSGIPWENTELKTGSANSVGKSPQPISIPISPNFFLILFFPENTAFDRENRDTVSVGTGFSRSRFHP